ncbi:integrase core domain-containing protein, partial [Mesorhizobium sp. M0115]|uniref:integrase core domain-containing protein n=1 Tax=Mesorhizobium sp. M0115 TaxID=2956883 RepID=UPI003339AE9A
FECTDLKRVGEPSLQPPIPWCCDGRLNPPNTLAPAILIFLHGHGIQPSMSRVGNPYDNARAESFMKTLKQEEVAGLARCTRCAATYRELH